MYEWYNRQNVCHSRDAVRKVEPTSKHARVGPLTPVFLHHHLGQHQPSRQDAHKILRSGGVEQELSVADGVIKILLLQWTRNFVNVVDRDRLRAESMGDSL